MLSGLVLSGVCLLAAPAAQAAEPASLAELERRLIQATKRLQALVEEVQRDPRERKLERYLRYGPKQMAARKREVKAEDIVDWMADGERNFEFRQACAKALQRGAMILGDPDLSLAKKRPGTMRGYFFAKHVVPLLDEKDDRNTRTLAASLLKQIYGSVAQVPEIYNYKADDPKTWDPAQREWKKYLKRK